MGKSAPPGPMLETAPSSPTDIDTPVGNSLTSSEQEDLTSGLLRDSGRPLTKHSLVCILIPALSHTTTVMRQSLIVLQPTLAPLQEQILLIHQYTLHITHFLSFFFRYLDWFKSKLAALDLCIKNRINLLAGVTFPSDATNEEDKRAAARKGQYFVLCFHTHVVTASLCSKRQAESTEYNSSDFLSRTLCLQNR